MRFRKRCSKIGLCKFSLGALLVSLLSLAWWGWVPPTIIDSRCHLNANAAWIGVEWTSQPVVVPAITTLADQARDHHLRYLFPFTTYMKADGSFNPTYAYAPAFIAHFRHINHETALVAWVGLPTQQVDLANQRTRAIIVAFLVRLVQEIGFDGVHLDAEPLPSGNLHYLRLLEELRGSLGRDSLISVAGLPWRSSIEEKVSHVEGYRWSIEYYQSVANRVDQIVVMAYDSFAPSPALYRLWVREQVRSVVSSLASTKVDLLIGISVSHEITSSHNPDAENLSNGLAGLCAGLTIATSTTNNIKGIALYAQWEANTMDWQLWEQWQAESAHYLN